MNEPKSLFTHWEHFICMIAPKLIDASMHTGSIIARPHKPSQAPNEEVSFQIQYVHPTMGARTDELILFRDGTWRYIPS